TYLPEAIVAGRSTLPPLSPARKKTGPLWSLPAYFPLVSPIGLVLVGIDPAHCHQAAAYSPSVLPKTVECGARTVGAVDIIIRRSIDSKAQPPAPHRLLEPFDLRVCLARVANMSQFLSLRGNRV